MQSNKKEKIFSVRFEDKLYDDLRSYSERTMIPFTAFIRRATKKALAEALAKEASAKGAE